MASGADRLIGIVGPCGSGKSTLVAALQAKGFRCRQVSQEHSYVAVMWQIITRPDVLIFLDASFGVCTTRRALGWRPSDYEEQARRLAHARAHADLVINTDRLITEEVFQQALDFLGRPSLGAPGSC